MNRVTVNAAMLEILSELTVKQEVAFAKNKKYAQLYATHDVVPEIATDIKVLLVRDEDITPTLPTKLDFALRVDEIYSDKACGYVVRAWVKEDFKVYTKAWGYGLGESQDWTPTDIGPNQ